MMTRSIGSIEGSVFYKIESLHRSRYTSEMIYDMSEIAFEQIHNEYYWAKYGEFKVIMNINTRYINATYLCGLATTKTGTKKEFRQWKQNSSTEELMGEVAAAVRMSTVDLTTVVNGGQVMEIKGTYVHPDLIPHIACWASPKFAVKVSKIVNEQIVRDHREAIRAKDTRIDELSRKMDELLKQNNELLTAANEARETHERVANEARAAQERAAEQIDLLTDDVENLSIDNTNLTEKVGEVQKGNETLIQKANQIAHKLDIATDNRVPPSPIPRYDQVYTVYHRPGTSLYKVVARQKKSLQGGITLVQKAGFTTCVYRCESPNAIKLRRYIEDTMLPHLCLGSASGSNITLAPNRTTEDLVKFIKAAEAEKKNV
jgi:hypothetical protein